MNIPGTALIVTIILFIASTASAEECKYKTNEADPFTREKIVLTKWKPFRPTGNEAVDHGWMAGAIEHGKKFLALRIGLVGYYGQPTVPEGGKLLILMADDTIVELAAYEEVKLSGRNAIVRFELDAASLQALTAQGTTDIRLSTIEDEHDFSFGNKPTGRMQYVLGCIQ
ncbi:MAG: hypothetical protein OEW73_07635 [Gammaproteobacteria bacterium]|nr:hypothetical protein [Gammaproteobacteria bacterium]MDH5240638.1 hypothetical protein [Gammaproteobacteria bacterium]MDH5260655.1 hypothetical protein [Gammaproteobacteria bacterium]MDH5582825.1 hypothetical protein [Gammaproteobacteria bacterium]